MPVSTYVPGELIVICRFSTACGVGVPNPTLLRVRCTTRTVVRGRGGRRAKQENGRKRDGEGKKGMGKIEKCGLRERRRV